MKNQFFKNKLYNFCSLMQILSSISFFCIFIYIAFQHHVPNKVLPSEPMVNSTGANYLFYALLVFFVIFMITNFIMLHLGKNK